MKLLTQLSFFFLVLLCSFIFKDVEKAEYYSALSGGAEEAIDGMIARLEKEKPTSLMNAYKGALLMKKAGFVKGVNSKVKTFKKGGKMLEAEIDNNPDQIEFRFLRLTIQEHAPKILNYDKKIEEDKSLVINAFGKLDGAMKSIILNYAKTSKVIKSSDLE